MKPMPILKFVGKWCCTRRFKTKPSAIPTSEKQRIVPSDAASGDRFSSMVALSNDGSTAVIGAYLDDNAKGTDAGSAYVYASVGGVLQQVAKLLPSPGKALDYFGSSVAISGDGSTIAVGAYGDDSKASAAGAVYVFTQVNGVWTQQAKILPADGSKNDYFAMSNCSLSNDGNTLAVGSIQDDPNNKTDAGSVYVYTRSAGVWTQATKLVAADAMAADYFGTSVAISGDGLTIAVGAYMDDTGVMTDAGSGYIFTKVGSVWTQQAKLMPPDIAAGDYFGIYSDISADGKTVIFGGHKHKTGGLVDSGAAYVYKYVNNAWVLIQTLSAPVPHASDFYGYTVGLSNDAKLLVVSAYGDDTIRSSGGCVYLYKDVSGVYTLVKKLTSSDIGTSVDFGTAVDISGNGNRILVGSNTTNVGLNSGAAYLFE